MLGLRWLTRVFSARISAIVRSLRGRQKSWFGRRLLMKFRALRSQCPEPRPTLAITRLSSRPANDRNPLEQITQQLPVFLTKTPDRVRQVFRKSSTAARHARPKRIRFESLRHEFLEERRLLTGNLFWGGGSGAWISNPSNWYTLLGVQTNWAPGDTAYIQGASCTITISGQVSPSAIFFGSGEGNGPYTVSGGTIALSASTSTVVDVSQGASAVIDSNIAGSSYTLTKQDAGQLTLGGSNSVTVGAMEDVDGGTLEIDNNVSITDGNNSHVGLLVANTAVLQGTGTVSLVATSPLSYQSSAASTFSGSITGTGKVKVNTPYLDPSAYSNTLILDGSKGGNNTYTGGTDIEYGTLRLANGATLGADTGALQVGGYGTLDLYGCSVTVGSLNDGTSGTSGGTITDNSTNPDSKSGNVTQLTVATSAHDIFTGRIEDNSSPNPIAPKVRLVMSGAGMLTLANANTYLGGTEIESGILQIGNANALPDNRVRL